MACTAPSFPAMRPARTKKPRRIAPAGLLSRDSAADQNAKRTCACRRFAERMAPPTKPKPISIMAQVAGSGTAAAVGASEPAMIAALPVA
jgi:hypothetical protein